MKKRSKVYPEMPIMDKARTTDSILAELKINAPIIYIGKEERAYRVEFLGTIKGGETIEL